MGGKILTSILIKPAGPDCNMACGYCFYSGKSKLFPETRTHRMSEPVLENVIRQAMEQSGDEVSIGWQGGEPTLMGLPFFNKAMAFAEHYGRGKSVGNGLQTNGLLLDRQWARFLKKFNFLVGLSIDGPEHIHDHYRRTMGGGRSWSQVRDAANMLLDEGVSVNALSVVNEYSVQFPDEVYDFLKGLGLGYMQFIPCVETDPADTGRAAPFSVTAEVYGSFLCRLFDRWRGDFENGRPSTSVRFFESLLFSYAGITPPECTLRETCGDYVVVEHNGDVYACDFFVESPWMLGNVTRDRLADLLNSPRQDTFGMMKMDLPQPCRECRWLVHCRGGCTKDRLRDCRDGGLNHFCGAFKIIFNHADKNFKMLTDSWRRKSEDERERRARVGMAGLPGRNDPCPCGSGLKYKKCCGRA